MVSVLARKRLTFFDVLGDSRAAVTDAPAKIMHQLDKWLKSTMGKFTYQGDSMEHGDQKDITECSIVTRNTIARAVFGDTLWLSSRRARERANCFVHLGKGHVEQGKVSCPLRY